MNRVFGKKKKAAPAPTLDEAAAGLGGRVDTMDGKIAGLENEVSNKTIIRSSFALLHLHTFSPIARPLHVNDSSASTRTRSKKPRAPPPRKLYKNEPWKS
jgi:hypothetical protein